MPRPTPARNAMARVVVSSNPFCRNNSVAASFILVAYLACCAHAVQMACPEELMILGFHCRKYPSSRGDLQVFLNRDWRRSEALSEKPSSRARRCPWQRSRLCGSKTLDRKLNMLNYPSEGFGTRKRSQISPRETRRDAESRKHGSAIAIILADVAQSRCWAAIDGASEAAILEAGAHWLLTPLSGSSEHIISPWIAWHGRLMVLSMGLLMPPVVLVARFFKITPRQDWPRQLDNPFWFSSAQALGSCNRPTARRRPNVCAHRSKLACSMVQPSHGARLGSDHARSCLRW